MSSPSESIAIVRRRARQVDVLRVALDRLSDDRREIQMLEIDLRERRRQGRDALGIGKVLVDEDDALARMQRCRGRS